MDAPAWTGDDDRELSAPPLCEECGVELYPEERERGTCARCHHEALDAERAPDYNAPTADERASVERDEMATIQRTLK